MSEKFNINTIKIQSFRGIVDYELDMSKKSLVLCGENGSGKSTLSKMLFSVIKEVDISNKKMVVNIIKGLM